MINQRDEERVCGICGDSYEPYICILTDDFNVISEYKELEEEYGKLCKSCRQEVTEHGGYAIADYPDKS